MLMRPFAGSDSDALTSVCVASRPLSRSRTVTATPSAASPRADPGSTTTALRRISWSRLIFVSRCACASFASWYSEFSFRSPQARAVRSRSAICRRPSVSSSRSSASSAASPSGVIWFPTCSFT